MRTVFIEDSLGACLYAQMLKSFGFKFTNNLEDADLVCFTGGADVHPRHYGQEKHPCTFSNPLRDENCLAIFERAKELKVPMLGICRGSQFLCVANGGKLWQDIDGHTESHIALTTDGMTFPVTSTHHQEMIPSGGEIIMVAAPGNYRSFMNKEGVQRTIKAATPTVEGVYWKDTNCLSIQGHPEFTTASQPFKNWTKSKILQLLMKEE